MDSSIRRRLLIAPPLIAGALILAFVVSGKKPPEQEPPAEQTTLVRVIELRKMPVIPRALGYGSVKPGRIWNAVVQVAGRVEWVHPKFKKGAILKAGTEIIRISPEDYAIAIRQSEANIRSAQSKITELRVSVENTKASLDIEQQTLRISETEFDRKLKLTQRGVLAKSVRDQEERILLGQRKRVLELQNTLRLIPTQIAAQNESKAVYESQLETAKLNLRRTHVTLPFDARIAEANVEATQFVGVGTVLGVADSMDTAEVDAQIPQGHLSALFRVAANGAQMPGGEISAGTLRRFAKKLGLRAIVRMSVADKSIEWQGEVVRISDTVDPKTRAIGTIVVVDNPYKDVVPGIRPPLIKGMFVEVELQARAIADQIIIPRASLHEGRAYLVNKDSRLEFRKVEINLIQGDFAVVASGLSAGDRLVVSNLSPAIEGMLLRTVVDNVVSARLKAQASAEGTIR